MGSHPAPTAQDRRAWLQVMLDGFWCRSSQRWLGPVLVGELHYLELDGGTVRRSLSSRA
jgi:hypothetical protein